MMISQRQARRLAVLAADIENHDLFGGSRSAEAANDIRDAIDAADHDIDVSYAITGDIRPHSITLGALTIAAGHPV